MLNVAHLHVAERDSSDERTKDEGKEDDEVDEEEGKNGTQDGRLVDAEGRGERAVTRAPAALLPALEPAIAVGGFQARRATGATRAGEAVTRSMAAGETLDGDPKGAGLSVLSGDVM